MDYQNSLLRVDKDSSRIALEETAHQADDHWHQIQIRGALCYLAHLLAVQVFTLDTHRSICECSIALM